MVEGRRGGGKNEDKGRRWSGRRRVWNGRNGVSM